MNLRSLFYFLLLFFSARLHAQDSTTYINSAEIIESGIAFHDAQEYGKALAHYQMVSLSDSNYAWSLSEQMVTLTAMTEYEQAIDLGKKGLTLPSKYKASIYSKLGSALDYNEEISEALEVLKEGHERYPYDQEILYNYGVTLLRDGQYSQAQEMFIRRLQLSPFHANSHYQLAELSVKQGFRAKAMMSYLLYLALNPSNLQALSRTEDLLIDKITEENSISAFSKNGFESLDGLIRSKVANTEAFKPGIKLNYRISRHAEVIIDQLKEVKSSDDFWTQFYLPFYQALTDKKLVHPFLYTIVSGVNNEDIQHWLKKNSKDVEALSSLAIEVIDLYKLNHRVSILGVEDDYRFWYYDDGSLNAIGNSNAEGTDVGPYIYFYSNQEVSARGTLNSEGNKTGKWEYFEPDGSLSQAETYDEQGRLQGSNLFYYPSGNLRSNVPYKDGTAEGLVKLYFDCDQLKETYEVTNNQIHGTGTIYYPSGRRQYEYQMQEGLLHGPYTEYFESGELAAKYNYSNGELDGLFERYHKNGQLAEKGHYKAGNIDGNWKGFFDNGQPEYDMNYNEGTPVETTVFYFKEGSKREEYTFDNSGALSGEYQTFDTDGALHYVYEYDSGKVIAYRFLDKEGKVLSQGNSRDSLKVIAYTSDGFKWFEAGYLNGKLNGNLTHFHTNGEVQYTVNTIDGQWQGEYLEYFPTGELKIKINYVDDQMNGWHYDYYQNGQISSVAMMVDGQLQQWYTAYHPEGTLKERVWYKNGEMDGGSYYYGPEGTLFIYRKYQNGISQEVTQYDKEGEVLSRSVTPQGSGMEEVLSKSGITRYELKLDCGLQQNEQVFYRAEGEIDARYQIAYGKYHGAVEDYHSNGQLRAKGFYKNGQMDSLWTWYDTRGNLTGEGNYKDGMAQGSNFSYYSNGQLEVDCVYKDDERNGPCKYYAPDGSLQVIKHYDYRRGPLSYQYELPNGSLSDPVSIDISTNFNLTAYFRNGKKSVEQNYFKGKLNGIQRYYFNNGEVNSEAVYHHGELEGMRKIYYANGQLQSEVPYSNGNEHGTAKHFYEDGTLYRTIEYKHGLKDGEEIWYQPDGTISKKLLFWNNVIY